MHRRTCYSLFVEKSIHVPEPEIGRRRAQFIAGLPEAMRNASTLSSRAITRIFFTLSDIVDS